MTIEIEFATIETRDAFISDSPPEGVSFCIDAVNEAGVIATAFILLVEITKPIAEGILASWIYDRVAKYDAKHIRVDGQETMDRADFERKVADDLEIGKND